jgi:hypothetical protein
VVAERVVSSASAAPEWRSVANSPRFSWVDARTRYPHRLPPAAFTGARSADVLEWRVPLLLDDEPAEVTGVVTWKSLR